METFSLILLGVMWSSGWGSGLVIPFAPISTFWLHFVYSQLVCLMSVRIFKRDVYLQYVFLICLYRLWKQSHRGSDQLGIHHRQYIIFSFEKCLRFSQSLVQWKICWKWKTIKSCSFPAFLQWRSQCGSLSSFFFRTNHFKFYPKFNIVRELNFANSDVCKLKRKDGCQLTVYERIW